MKTLPFTSDIEKLKSAYEKMVAKQRKPLNYQYEERKSKNKEEGRTAKDL